MPSTHLGRPLARLARLALSGLAAAVLAALVAPSAAGANGNPVSVVLTYMNGVSNWGPPTATGVIEVIAKEGEAKLSATGLPRLNGEQYQIWLTRAGSDEYFPLGRFNATEEGVAKHDVILADPIPDRGWNMVLISVEPDPPPAGAPAAPAAPGQKKTIAGRYPEPPVGPGSGQGQGSGLPPELPRTGGDHPAAGTTTSPAAAREAVSGSLALLIAVALVGMGLGTAAGLGIGRLGLGRRAR